MFDITLNIRPKKRKTNNAKGSVKKQNGTR